MCNTKKTRSLTYHLRYMMLLCSMVLMACVVHYTKNNDYPATTLSATSLDATATHSISTHRATQIPATTGNGHHYNIRKTNKAKLQIKGHADNEPKTYLQGRIWYVVSNNVFSTVVVGRPGYYLFLFRYTPF